MPVVLRCARTYAEYISIQCVTTFYGFRPYGGSLFPDAEKVTMDLSRDNGRLAQARWFPHSGAVMGIRVVWTYVWLQQKQKQNPSQTPQNLAQNVLAPTDKPLTSRTRLSSITQRSQNRNTRFT